MELTAKPTAVPARPGHFPYPGFRSAPVQGKRINSKPNKYQPCVVACPYTS